MSNTNAHTTDGSESTAEFGVPPGERDQILLDDLRVETRRLADAIERQNELLERITNDLDDVDREVVQ